MDKDYGYVRAWYEVCRGDSPQRVRSMVLVANDDDAPANAVFRRMDATWATFDDLSDEDKERVQADVGRRIMHCPHCNQEIMPLFQPGDRVRARGPVNPGANYRSKKGTVRSDVFINWLSEPVTNSGDPSHDE